MTSLPGMFWLLALALLVAACEVIPAFLLLRWAADAGPAVLAPELRTALLLAGVAAALVALRVGLARSFTAVSMRSARSFVRYHQHELLRAFAEAPWLAVARLDAARVRLCATTQAEEERAWLLRALEAAGRGPLFLGYLAGFFVIGHAAVAWLLIAGAGAGVGLALVLRRGSLAEHSSELTHAYRRFMSDVDSLLHLNRVRQLGPMPGPLESAAHQALATVDEREARLRRAMFRAQVLRMALFSLGALTAAALLFDRVGTGLALIEGLVAARALLAVAGTLNGLGTALPRAWKLSQYRRSLLADLAMPSRLGGGPNARSPAFPRPGKIELTNITFAYAATANVLDGVTLTLIRGQIITIEGDSGAGKSTLADLLAGLVVPASGEVRLDGERPEHLDAALRHAAMIVPPSPAFIDGGIRSNLRLWRPQAAEAELVEALHQSAADFALEQQDSVAQVRDRDPQQLSHGQRQRLAIARALLARPVLLILDEALSALDGAAQARILESLAATRQERITVIITHDSTRLPQRAFDQRLRLHKGRLHSLSDAHLLTAR